MMPQMAQPTTLAATITAIRMPSLTAEERARDLLADPEPSRVEVEPSEASDAPGGADPLLPPPAHTAHDFAYAYSSALVGRMQPPGLVSLKAEQVLLELPRSEKEQYSALYWAHLQPHTHTHSVLCLQSCA